MKCPNENCGYDPKDHLQAQMKAAWGEFYRLPNRMTREHEGELLNNVDVYACPACKMVFVDD